MSSPVSSREFAQHDTLIKRLHTNWNLQILFVLIGLVYVYEPSLGADASALVKLPVSLANLIVPITLPYLFICWGYLLASFLQSRLRIERKLMSPPDELGHDEAMKRCDGFFVFDIIHRIDGDKVRLKDTVPWHMAMLLGTCVIAANHAVTVYYVLFENSLHLGVKSVLLFVLLVLILACYVQFVNSVAIGLFRRLFAMTFAWFVVLILAIWFIDTI